MAAGGFDVVIGNPPYVEISPKKVNYIINQVSHTECGNLYAPITSRSLTLLGFKGAFSFIVPGASVNTPRMSQLLDLLQSQVSYLQLTQYDERPSKLFDGVDQQLCIQVGLRNGEEALVVSPMRHWYTPSGLGEERGSYLFGTNESIKVSSKARVASVIPKIGYPIEIGLLEKLSALNVMDIFVQENSQSSSIYYRNAGGRYWRLVKSFPSYFMSSSGASSSTTEHEIHVLSKYSAIASTLYSSSLFYWFWRVASNCRHLTKREFENFQVPKVLLVDPCLSTLKRLRDEYEASLKINAVRKTVTSRASGVIEQDEYRVAQSKSIIDQIDKVIAAALGITEEELDYIINYDIKYRMGLNGAEVDEDD